LSPVFSGTTDARGLGFTVCGGASGRRLTSEHNRIPVLTRRFGAMGHRPDLPTVSVENISSSRAGRAVGFFYDPSKKHLVPPLQVNLSVCSDTHSLHITDFQHNADIFRTKKTCFYHREQIDLFMVSVVKGYGGTAPTIRTNASPPPPPPSQSSPIAAPMNNFFFRETVMNKKCYKVVRYGSF
jgi:hypothetical protein